MGQSHQHRQQQQHHEGVDEERPGLTETELRKEQQQDSNPCRGDSAALSWEGADNARHEPAVTEPRPAQASGKSRCLSAAWKLVKMVISGVILGATLSIVLSLLSKSSGAIAPH